MPGTVLGTNEFSHKETKSLEFLSTVGDRQYGKLT